jgi:hypothetical protein
MIAVPVSSDLVAVEETKITISASETEDNKKKKTGNNDIFSDSEVYKSVSENSICLFLVSCIVTCSIFDECIEYRSYQYHGHAYINSTFWMTKTTRQ